VARWRDELAALVVTEVAQVVSVSGECRVVVMSNEAMVGTGAPDYELPYRPKVEAALTDIIEALQPESTTIRMYVRRQDRLLESQYIQQLHDGLVMTFEEFTDRAAKMPLIQFGDLARRVGVLPTVDELIVRPFEIIRSGSLAFIRDFFTSLGLRDAHIPAIANIGQRNASYTEPAMKAAIAINGLLETEEQKRRTRKFLGALFPKGRYPKPRLFDKEARTSVLDMYREHNEAFFEEFLPQFPRDAYSTPEPCREIESYLANLAHLPPMEEAPELLQLRKDAEILKRLLQYGTGASR
ncbi:MAG: hypothetical protein QGG40_09180, partial [Myxococcota bacterium]|nr:hypothetical protein [Myxococcota bacterium]